MLNLFSGPIGGNCGFNVQGFKRYFLLVFPFLPLKNCQRKTEIMCRQWPSWEEWQSKGFTATSFLTTLGMTLVWYWGLPFLITAWKKSYWQKAEPIFHILYFSFYFLRQGKDIILDWCFGTNCRLMLLKRAGGCWFVAFFLFFSPLTAGEWMTL